MRCLFLSFCALFVTISAEDNWLLRSDGSHRINVGMQFLKRHQRSDGSWSGSGTCTNKDCPLAGDVGDPLVLTSLAALTMIGASYDHRMPTQYKGTMKAALQWLLTAQSPDGVWSQRTEAHALALLCLAELSIQTQDPILRDPIKRGLDILLQRRATSGPLLGAWVSTDHPEQVDMATTVLANQACTAAIVGGVADASVRQTTAVWARHVWETGDHAHFPAHFPRHPGVTSESSFANAGGLALLALTEAPIQDASYANLVDAVMAPASDTVKMQGLDPYELWWSAIGLYQTAPERFLTWLFTWAPEGMIAIQHQDSLSCLDGSWPARTNSTSPPERSSLETTALHLLTLEFLYRYQMLPTNSP